MGQYNVVKCWDLALTNLHAGEKIKIFCPARWANGGAEGYSDLDSFRIPENTDLTYDLEVLECEPSINTINSKLSQYKLEKLKKKTNAERKMEPEVNKQQMKDKTKKDVAVLKKVIE